MNDAQAAKKPGKNIIICLDGTGNQFGSEVSNVVKLYRMLERTEGEQVAYYDPGVGTMGDPTYKTWTARKINKILGLAFGRGLTKNLIEAYTYLMEHYETGDKVFIFGFSRGAYTARALAGFIKNCGLFEKGSHNLLPYAMGLFLKQAPERIPKQAPESDARRKAREEADERYRAHFKVLSGFRDSYGRQFSVLDDPKEPRKKTIKPGDKPYNSQLRIHFLGLFDTVKSYGWVRNPVKLPSESRNPSVLNVRHALAIDERRIFFRQMHWIYSPNTTCKEVWFPGVHSDIGGGYPEKDSGLAKIALEWMVHEGIELGMKVDPFKYAQHLGKIRRNEKRKWEAGTAPGYPAPDAGAPAHESLKGAWRAAQLLPKSLEKWEDNKHRRTITSERERLNSEKEKDPNPVRVHQSVYERMSAGPVATITKPDADENYPKAEYRPENLPELGDNKRERTSQGLVTETGEPSPLKAFLQAVEQVQGG
jgi:uncharacterized protein (DUF2235 family)